MVKGKALCVTAGGACHVQVRQARAAVAVGDEFVKDEPGCLGGVGARVVVAAPLKPALDGRVVDVGVGRAPVIHKTSDAFVTVRTPPLGMVPAGSAVATQLSWQAASVLVRECLVKTHECVVVFAAKTTGDVMLARGHAINDGHESIHLVFPLSQIGFPLSQSGFPLSQIALGLREGSVEARDDSGVAQESVRRIGDDGGQGPWGMFARGSRDEGHGKGEGKRL